MAVESNDSQELKVISVSPEEVKNLIEERYNIDLGVITFSEGIRDLGEYNTSSSSDSSNTDSSTGSSGGLQNTKTEFGDGGVKTLSQMLDRPENIVELPVKEKGNKGKSSNKDKEYEKE